MYINKVILFGNLTRDPELRALPTGMNVCNFSIATNRTFTDKAGKRQEQTEFHNVVVFGRQADLVSQYLKKGSTAFIEGRLQTRNWEKEGQKQYRTEILAEQIQFGPRAGGSSSSGAPTGRSFDASPEETDTGSSNPGIEYPKDEINPDDIPF